MTEHPCVSANLKSFNHLRIEGIFIRPKISGFSQIPNLSQDSKDWLN